jgi:hypothetical protein
LRTVALSALQLSQTQVAGSLVVVRSSVMVLMLSPSLPVQVRR